MTTPPNSEPPNEPPSREAVEAAIAFVQDIGQTKASAEWIKAIDVITRIAPDTSTAYTVARILAAEVQRLRALVDEPQGKQIKPGPDKPVPELDIYCAACGQPSLTSHWFAKSHTAMCPLCAAEFNCNAGRVG